MDYARPKAKRVVDLTGVGHELGYFRNPCGNFSILPWDNGAYLAHFRIFQYWIDSDRFRYWQTANEIEHDRHHFVWLDADFNFAGALGAGANTYFQEPDFIAEKPYLEDGRMVSWPSGIYMASAIFYQQNEKYERFGMEIQKVRVSGGEASTMHTWNSCEHGIVGRHKNWMAVPDRPFNFVTATYEHGAQTIDISGPGFSEAGDCSGEMYRGSSPLLKTAGGYEAITHRVWRAPRGGPIYVNYLTSFGGDLAPTGHSRPFKLCDACIEFVTGMVELPGGEVAVCVTEMDDKPMVMIFDREELRAAVK